jgi:hypothetical protein
MVTCHLFLFVVPLLMFGCSIHTPFLLLVGFDLNLPLDEFGTVDMDFVKKYC